MSKPTGYDMSRAWFDFAFENPERITPTHAAVYFYAIEHCNRLGWKEKFGFPTTMVMEAIGIKSYKTYIKVFNDLVDWGFFKLIQKKRNEHTANIIALVKFTEASTKALDKAILTHTPKQGKPTVSINKQETTNHKPQTTNKDAADKSTEYFMPLKNCFLAEYKRRTNLDFQFNGKEGNHLKQLATKIKNSLTGAGAEVSEQTMVNTLQALMTKHNDRWINDNFSISILNSKYNEIVSNIKNRQPKTAADMQQQVNAELDKYFGARQ
jgi:F0F1-type ATP synthase delta subunit